MCRPLGRAPVPRSRCPQVSCERNPLGNEHRRRQKSGWLSTGHLLPSVLNSIDTGASQGRGQSRQGTNSGAPRAYHGWHLIPLRPATASPGTHPAPKRPCPGSRDRRETGRTPPCGRRPSAPRRSPWMRRCSTSAGDGTPRGPWQYCAANGTSACLPRYSA